MSAVQSPTWGCRVAGDRRQVARGGKEGPAKVELDSNSNNNSSKTGAEAGLITNGDGPNDGADR